MFRMKKLIGTGFLLLLAFCIQAAHISGGEMYYRFLGKNSDGKLRYLITLRLFRDCNLSGETVAEMPDKVIIGIFHNKSGYPAVNDKLEVDRTDLRNLQLTSPLSCILNPPKICYQVGSFSKEVLLDDTNDGFIATYQTCCRISNISNTVSNAGSQSGDPGATYTCKIPGRTILGPNGVNSSPVFILGDTALVCRGKRLSLNFSAADPDPGDSLSYRFSSAYGSGRITSAAETSPSPPPYGTLTYQPGYSGDKPLGNNVSIDAKTGLISGITPSGGIITANGSSYFVVSVEIEEWREQKMISVHRKDFILKITACDLADAALPEKTVNCNTLSITFENIINSSENKTFYWESGFGATSTAPKPTFTYPAAGDYTVMLIVNRGDECTDTAYSKIAVYPGFAPDFDIQAGCVDIPVLFSDKTFARYGQVNYWKWDFGDLSTTNDVSLLRNPEWKYSTAGNKSVRLIAGSDKGCMDTTLPKVFDLLPKPSVDLKFRDTLICVSDTLQLRMSGPGTFTWSDNYMISNLHIAEPNVSPDYSHKYYVDQLYLGCTNRDSVLIRVIDHVDLGISPLDTICRTDEIKLSPKGNGLYFKWEPSATLDRDDIKNPLALPTAPSTTYSVRASVGKCYANASTTIVTVPYPTVDAGPDHIICSDSLLLLSGTHNGAFFTWSPAKTLYNSQTLTPTAFPSQTTSYTLTVRDTMGCPKPVSDIVKVTVIPPVIAFAGNDTSIVAGQPLLFNATGGDIYEWSPSFALSNTRIFNPSATLNSNQTYILKAITNIGSCYAYDTVNIKVFKTMPDIFVPNAFTPNKDGINDIFMPNPVGIARLDFFQVYNRWGERVFYTSQTGKGWDGTIKGVPQNSGSFVWMAQGIDYTGKKIFRKGTVLLVR